MGFDEKSRFKLITVVGAGGEVLGQLLCQACDVPVMISDSIQNLCCTLR